MIINTKAAGWASNAALSRTSINANSSNFLFKSQPQKRKPGYERELENYPFNSPVLVAQSWAEANLIRNQWGGFCLLVNDHPEHYDFASLAHREVWVLSKATNKNEDLKLGQTIQLAGAKTVFIIGGYYE